MKSSRTTIEMAALEVLDSSLLAKSKSLMMSLPIISIVSVFTLQFVFMPGLPLGRRTGGFGYDTPVTR